MLVVCEFFWVFLEWFKGCIIQRILLGNEQIWKGEDQIWKEVGTPLSSVDGLQFPRTVATVTQDLLDVNGMEKYLKTSFRQLLNDFTEFL